MNINHQIQRAAAAIVGAQGLIITAGAGMGVDSGLPDFRGTEGFWRAYPTFKDLNLQFEEIADPRWFDTMPMLAWGFYGHRRDLYQKTVPHAGFDILKRWGDAAPLGARVITTNVDGAFQKSGFKPEYVVEYHGTIHRSQCTNDMCRLSGSTWNDPHVPELSPKGLVRNDSYPRCPECGTISRPNILMFSDTKWNGYAARMSMGNFNTWLDAGDGLNYVIIECGAGTAIPSLRHMARRFTHNDQTRHNITLIRINPREWETSADGIGIPLGSLEGLTRIDEELNAFNPL